jgi:hypothetical protein
MLAMVMVMVAEEEEGGGRREEENEATQYENRESKHLIRTKSNIMILQESAETEKRTT